MTDEQGAPTSGVMNESGTNHVPHILVVDGDPSLRRLLQHVLSANGYAVSTAEDGQAALDVVTEQRPDLVITDIVMPRRNWLEFVKVLHTRHPGLPMLAMSVSGPVALPDVPTLDKPFRMVELLDTMRALLAESAGT